MSWSAGRAAGCSAATTPASRRRRLPRRSSAGVNAVPWMMTVCGSSASNSFSLGNSVLAPWRRRASPRRGGRRRCRPGPRRSPSSTAAKLSHPNPSTLAGRSMTVRARCSPKMNRSTLRTNGSEESPAPFMPWIAVTPPTIARISAYRSRAPGMVSSLVHQPVRRLDEPLVQRAVAPLVAVREHLGRLPGSEDVEVRMVVHGGYVPDELLNVLSEHLRERGTWGEEGWLFGLAGHVWNRNSAGNQWPERVTRPA